VETIYVENVAGDGEADTTGAMDVDSRNEWRLQPEGRAVLTDLLRLDEAQAMAVIASALEAVALSRGGGGGGGGGNGNGNGNVGGGNAASWLLDVAAHAMGLAERVGGVLPPSKRPHVSASLR
jgi:hypothetical protein